jgi:hypothetical protein
MAVAAGDFGGVAVSIAAQVEIVAGHVRAKKTEER